MRRMWTLEKKQVRGTLTSDIPFGTFDIPIVVTDATRSEAVWVKVVDGVGAFDVAGPWKKPKVELDPAHATLTRQKRLVFRK